MFDMISFIVGYDDSAVIKQRIPSLPDWVNFRNVIICNKCLVLRLELICQNVYKMSQLEEHIRRWIGYDDVSMVRFVMDVLGGEHLWIVQYVGNGVMDNVYIMNKVIEMDTICVRYESEKSMNNSEFMGEVIKRDYRTAGCAGIRVRDDMDIMREVVKKNWKCLFNGGENVRNDVSIVLSAVKQNWSAIQWAGERPMNDVGVMKIVVEQEGFAFVWVGEELKDNDEIAEIVARDSVDALESATERIKSKLGFYDKLE